MKIKLNTNLIINLIVLGFITLIAVSWLSFYFIHSNSVTVSGDHSVYNSWSDYTLKPIDEQLDPNLSHTKYTHLSDSIKNVRELKNGIAYIGSGSQFLIIGSTWAFQCDTCTKMPRGWNEDKMQRNYYIELIDWKLRQDYLDGQMDFHVENGQSYLRKVITDTSIVQKNGSIYNKNVLPMCR